MMSRIALETERKQYGDRRRGRPATCYGFALLRFGGSKYGVTALLQIIRQRAVAVIKKFTQVHSRWRHWWMPRFTQQMTTAIMKACAHDRMDATATDMKSVPSSLKSMPSSLHPGDRWKPRRGREVFLHRCSLAGHCDRMCENELVGKPHT